MAWAGQKDFWTLVNSLQKEISFEAVGATYVLEAEFST